MSVFVKKKKLFFIQTLFKLQWPQGMSGGGACASCPDCDAEACDCVDPQKTGCFSGVCGPNGANFMPKEYVMSFKYENLDSCDHIEPGNGSHCEGCPTSQRHAACKPTVLAVADSKGSLQNGFAA